MADDDLDGAPLEDLDGVPMPMNVPLPAQVAGGGAWAAVAPPPAAAAPLSFSLGGGGGLSSMAPAPVVPPTVSAAKLALFDKGASGVALTQTPYARRMAEQEAKRKKAEEEAAKEYAQFVKEFEVGPGASSGAPPASSNSRPGIVRRGVPPGRSNLLTHKAFVSGGVMGGDMPASAAAAASSSSSAAASSAAIAAPASSSFTAGGPPVGPGGRPMDPATLRAGLPSTSAPPKATPFAFSSSPAFGASAPPTSSSSSSGTGTGGVASAFSLDADAPTDDSSGAPAKKRKLEKKRNIDAFLEEMKQDAQDKAAGIVPSSLHRHGDSFGGGASSGRHLPADLGDPSSTNIYVGSLPSDITEKKLCEYFAAYGDIASVKIMWPRHDDEASRRKGHCGFVSFMRRADAEVAIRDMQNKVVDGTQLRLNWSRSVALPATPMVLKTSPSDARAGKLKYPGSESGPLPAPLPAAASFVFPPDAVKYQVEFPEDEQLRRFIDLVASHVSEHGVALEQALQARAATAAASTGNPAAPASPDAQLAFLSHPTSLEHLYYRWRVYSLSQGDSLRHWRSRPFQMLAGGPFFIPPDEARFHAEQEARRAAREEAREKKREAEREAARVERRKAERAASGKQGNWDKTDPDGVRDRADRGKLSESSQSMFMELLRHVTMDKAHVRDVMGWCLDHSDASKDIVDLLVEALTIDETPINKKIARLYVVSDILYNSSAPIPNASSYRSLLQSHLVAVFGSLHRAHVAATAQLGRISADAIRTKVMLLFKAWNQWALFPGPFLQQLEDTFTKGEAAASAPTHTHAA